MRTPPASGAHAPTPRGARSACYVWSMESVTGTIEAGVVRMDKAPHWQDGQRVLVIALPAEASHAAPPPELLEEDALEFATKTDVVRDVNEPELK